MRLFADHCIPTDVVHILRGLGIDVQRAIDAGLARATDDALFRYAQRHGQVLLTADRDFGDIVRFNILSKSALLRRVQDFFRDIHPRSLRGKLTLVEPTRTRIWPKS